MTYEEAIFYVIAAVTVAGSLGVVTARNVIHSALFLILALLGAAVDEHLDDRQELRSQQHVDGSDAEQRQDQEER